MSSQKRHPNNRVQDTGKKCGVHTMIRVIYIQCSEMRVSEMLSS
jgi:hypothetical protein